MMVTHMYESVPLSLLDEADVLKWAARLVGKNEIEQAVKLLEEAHLARPRSEKLLSILSNLHQRLGEYDKARRYTEEAFYNSLPSQINIEFDLPSEDDFYFLDQKSNELEEVEYSFEQSVFDKNEPPRKTLSLKTDIKKTSHEDTDNVRIFHKGKQYCIQPNLSKNNDEVTSEPTSSITPLTSNTKEHESSIPESIIDSGEYQNEDVLDAISPEWDLDFVNSCPDESYSDEEVFDHIEYIAVEEFIDEERTQFTFQDHEEELYTLWLDDDYLINDEDETSESEVLDNRLTFEDRARFIAVECIIKFGWHTNKLPFLIEVFTGRGWSNSRKALEREVQSGATVEELELAFEIKKLWQDSSRYWITFSKVWAAGESTDATYRHFSWKQALRLVRLFEGVTSFDEIHDFLELEFEYWYDNSVLRRCFPAFNKYLFNCRLHGRSMSSMFGCFDVPEGYDGLNASWSYHTNSDEMLALKEMGVDLVSKLGPNNTFASDIYTADYMLELWKMSEKSKQGGED